MGFLSVKITLSEEKRVLSAGVAVLKSRACCLRFRFFNASGPDLNKD